MGARFLLTPSNASIIVKVIRILIVTRSISKAYYPLRWEIILFMGAVHLLALAALPFASTTNLIALAVLYPLTAMGVTI